MARTSEPRSGMIGKPVPSFALPDQEGKKHKLSDYKGKHVVLFLYPKDDKPGYDSTHDNRIAAQSQ